MVCKRGWNKALAIFHNMSPEPCNRRCFLGRAKWTLCVMRLTCTEYVECSCTEFVASCGGIRWLNCFICGVDSNIFENVEKLTSIQKMWVLWNPSHLQDQPIEDCIILDIKPNHQQRTNKQTSKQTHRWLNMNQNSVMNTNSDCMIGQLPC